MMARQKYRTTGPLLEAKLSLLVQRSYCAELYMSDIRLSGSIALLWHSSRKQTILNLNRWYIWVSAASTEPLKCLARYSGRLSGRAWSAIFIGNPRRWGLHWEIRYSWQQDKIRFMQFNFDYTTVNMTSPKSTILCIFSYPAPPVFRAEKTVWWNLYHHTSLPMWFAQIIYRI